MAARLKPWRGRRIVGMVLIGAVVCGLHGTTLGFIAAAIAQWNAPAAPDRLRAVFTRTLEPAAVVPVPAPPPPTHMARASASRRAAPAARAESASEEAKAEPVVAARDGAVDEPAIATSRIPEALDAAIAASAADAASATSMPALADASAAASDAGAAAPGFAWPVSTRVSYALTGNYRGAIDGRAEVEWIRVGERYQVDVSLFAGPEFAPIFSRRMSSTGSIAADGLAPARYDEDTRFLMRERRVSVLFADDSVELANGQKRERLSGVQDTASQFIQFTWLFGSRPDVLRSGAIFEFPLALPRNLRRWSYEVVGEETLATSFGPLAAYHLKPKLGERKPGELAVEMWFSPDLRYLPVRIRIEQDEASWLDLVIARKPEMAAS